MSRTATTPRRARERGISMVIALIALATLLLTAATGLLVGSAGVRSTRSYRGTGQVHFVAESAISEAVQRVNGPGVIHFEDDVVWSSPKALHAVGCPTVHGKDALRSYLRAVLEPVTSLRFAVRRIIWDPETSELSIIYDRDIDGKRDRASEILRFGESGRVVSGEVHYGVVP